MGEIDLCVVEKVMEMYRGLVNLIELLGGRGLVRG